MKKFPFRSYVAFGSNVGRKKNTLEKAVHALSRIAQIKVTRVSSLYKTAPVGGPKQNDFLNGVLELYSSFSPQELWQELQRIEKKFGRVRRKKWGPRTLDLDLLTHGDLAGRYKGLILPHPRYHLRKFVLSPFCELAPRFRHPRFLKENRSFLRQLTVLGQRVTMVGQWKKSQYFLFKKRKKKKPPS